MGTFITKYADQMGLKMEDARHHLEIEVLPKDIRKAKPLSSKSCAFACAAKRDLGVKAAFFFRSTAWLQFDGKLVRYQLPNSMQKEIVSFDRARVMAPGTYRFGPFEGARTLGAYRRKNKRLKGLKRTFRPPSGERRVQHATMNIREAGIIG
jgi:hypothetical protein